MKHRSLRNPIIRIIIFTSVCLAALGVSTLSTAQGTERLDSRGTEFWVAFPQNFTGSQLDPILFLSSSEATSATINIPGIEFSLTLDLEPNIAQAVQLPIEVEITTTDAVSAKGILVEAEAEISVYGLSQLSFTTDAYLGLPTDVLGTEYIVSAWGTGLGGQSQYAFVASEDNTEVTIVPAESELCGVEQTILLNQGETYQHLSCDGGDLTGTRLTANHPIAVFGGHQCANVPSNDFFACDHIVEQIPPTQAWGTQFLTVPLATRVNGDTFRVIASEDNTNVIINQESAAVLNSGQVFETILTEPSRIETSAPSLLVQFSNSSSFDDVTSDPFKMIIPPFEQFLDSYAFSVPVEGFITNFANIVVDANLASLLLLDGEALPSELFVPISDSGFVGATVELAPGSHSLVGAVAGVFTYGFNSFDSYGYPGGLSLSAVASIDSLEIVTDALEIQPDGEACANALVLDEEEQPLQDIRVDFAVSIGNLETEMGSELTDTSGNAEFCSSVMPSLELTEATIVVTVGGFEATDTVEVVLIPELGDVLTPQTQLDVAQGAEICVPLEAVDQFGRPFAMTVLNYVAEFAGMTTAGQIPDGEGGNLEVCVTAPSDQEGLLPLIINLSVGSETEASFTVTADINVVFLPVATDVQLITSGLEVVEDEEACISLLVSDQRGDPLPNEVVSLDMSVGSTNFQGEVTTDENGIGEFCFIIPAGTTGNELMITFSSGEFNKEVGTDITIIEKSVDISGNINSGSGSTGGIGLFIMIILLARKYRTALSRAVTVTCAVLGAAISGSASAEFGWYAGTKVGAAEYIDVDRSIANTINQADGDVGFSIDDSTTGYVIYGGYQFLGWLALEASYLDMDEYSAKLSGSVDEPETLAADLVKDIAPSVEGIGLGVSALWSPVEKLSVRPNAGAFFYDVEKEVSINEFSFQQDDSGIGYYGGVNVMYPIKPELNIGFAYDTYWNEDNDRVAELFSVQLEYTFGL